MNKMNVGLSMLVILVLMMGVIVISGCVSPEEEVSEREEKEEIKDDYLIVNEIQATGNAKELDEVFKPILESILGGAKLIVSSERRAVVLEYVTKRPIVQSDLPSIIDALGEQGYQKLMDMIDSDDFLVQFAKTENAMLAIEGSFEKQYIWFSWAEIE